MNVYIGMFLPSHSQVNSIIARKTRNYGWKMIPVDVFEVQTYKSSAELKNIQLKASFDIFTLSSKFFAWALLLD